MNNYVKKGDTLELAAPADMSSGEARMVGGLLAVAHEDVLTGVRASFLVEGVVELPKDAVAFVEGELIYWDDTAKTFKKSASGFFGCATAAKAAGAGVATVEAKLFGHSVDAVP